MRTKRRFTTGLPAVRITAALSRLAFTVGALSVLLPSLALAAGNSTGKIPLTELGTGTYQGFEGGLYPGGLNDPPVAHFRAAKKRARHVVPRDEFGNPDANGKIALLAIGMSNTTQEFAQFERQEDANPHRNAQLVLVNAARGGQGAVIIADPNADYWTDVVQNRLDALTISAEQVQVVWLKEVTLNPGSFPGHAVDLRIVLGRIVRILRWKYPNLALCYLSSRSYGGYSVDPGNPEPQAYETGFSVKWLIEDQIQQVDPKLNYDPANGAVEAPLLLWGPYLWADGEIPRRDGLTWLLEDFAADHLHPSASGEQKVADLLSTFFRNHPTTRPWWRRQPGTSLVVVEASHDSTVREEFRHDNFGSEKQLFTGAGPFEELIYLKFDASSALASGATLLYAKLSLRVAGRGGDDITVVSDSNWDESTITCDSRPVIDGALLASFNDFTKDSSVAADATAALLQDGDKVLSLALTSNQLTSPPEPRKYQSKESGQAPRLVLVVRDPTPPPPRVADVTVSGQAWSAPPFSLIFQPDRLLPWLNVDRIAVTFDQDVSVTMSSLTLAGVNVTSYPFSGFAYDAGTRTATWTLSQAIGTDKLRLDLSGEPGDASPVRGASGLLLDGGSDFERRFDILTGDVNQDALVDSVDQVVVLFNQIAGDYHQAADLNGDDTVDASDLLLVQGLVVLSPFLPVGEPVDPS